MLFFPPCQFRVGNVKQRCLKVFACRSGRYGRATTFLAATTSSDTSQVPVPGRPLALHIAMSMSLSALRPASSEHCLRICSLRAACVGIEASGVYAVVRYPTWRRRSCCSCVATLASSAHLRAVLLGQPHFFRAVSLAEDTTFEECALYAHFSSSRNVMEGSPRNIIVSILVIALSRMSHIVASWLLTVSAWQHLGLLLCCRRCCPRCCCPDLGAFWWRSEWTC